MAASEDDSGLDLEAPCWQFLDGAGGGINLAQEFEQACSTFRKIPVESVRPYATLLGVVCSKALQGSALTRGRAWRLFMLLPRLVLWAPRGIRGGRQHRNRAAQERGRLVRDRLRRCWEGEADEVYREYQRACGPRPVRPSGDASPTRTDEDEYLANEVMRLCAEGEWSRACGLLSSPGVAPRSPDTVTSLQALWRTVAREEVPAYRPPAPAVRRVIQEQFQEHLKGSLSSASRGSGAGLSGCRFEFLTPLLESPEAFSSFSRLAVAVAAGEAPADIAHALSWGRATALRKGRGGVRPLVCHEPLRRLCARTLARAARIPLRNHLGPRQFAVGRSGGAEALGLTVRHLAEKYPTKVWLKLDLANAYNMQSRQASLRQLAQAAPALCAFQRLFYSSPSQYWYRVSDSECSKLLARDGIEQGDPAGPAQFACGLKELLDAMDLRLQVAAQARGLPPPFLFAYLDDTVIGVEPELLAEAFDIAAAETVAVGHALRPSESSLWSPTSPCPAGFENIWRPAGLLVAGVPVGTPDHQKSKASQVLGDTTKLCEKVVQLCERAPVGWCRRQSAWQLLRLCCLPRLDFLAGCIAPELLQHIALAFDHLIEDAAGRIFDLRPEVSRGALSPADEALAAAPLHSLQDSDLLRSLLIRPCAFTPLELMQLRVPVQRGGFGLRPISSGLDVAYVGTALRASASIRAAGGLTFMADQLSPAPGMEQSLVAAVASCARAGSPAVPAWGMEDSDTLRWQTLAGASRISRLFQDFEAAAGPAQMGRIHSCAGVGAQWLCTGPSEPYLEIPDEDLVFGVLFRLGRSLMTPGPCSHVSRLGNPCPAQADALGYHTLHCATEGGRIKRHDGVASTVLGLLESIPGILVRWKPLEPLWSRPGSDEPGEPDLLVDGLRGQRSVYLDVMITVAPIFDGAERAGHAAKRGEGRKRSRYRVCDAAGRRRLPQDFAPFVLEAHGRFGASAQAVIKRFAHLRASALGLSVSAEVQRWYAAIAISLLRENRRIFTGQSAPSRGRPTTSGRQGYLDLAMA